MKKIISALLILAVVLAFASCGENTSDASETTKENNTKIEETTSSESSEETETAEAVDYSAFEGTYTDSWSDRASAVLSAEDDCVRIEIRWGQSAYTTAVWTMSATLADGKLSYTDCEYKLITQDASNAEKEEVLYNNGEGYFTVGDGNALIWDGSQDEDCVKCCFNKNK